MQSIGLIKVFCFNYRKFSRAYLDLINQRKSKFPIHLDAAVKFFQDSSLVFPNRECITTYYKDGVRERHIKSLKNALKKLKIDIDDNAFTGELFDKFEAIVNEHLEKGIIAEYSITDSDSSRTYTYRLRSFYLTKEGIDVLLKIQAHEDSERRHIDNQKLSKSSARNSTIAIAVSVVSVLATLVFSINNYRNQELRLKQTEQQLKISSEQLELANERFELLHQQIKNNHDNVSNKPNEAQ